MNKGKHGENIASDYLEQSEYTIVERNFRSKRGEIDIICKDQKNTLVFVEVKYYKKDSWYNPLSIITKTKQKRLYTTAQYYLLKKNHNPPDCRFDVIIVEDECVKEHLEHVIFHV